MLTIEQQIWADFRALSQNEKIDILYNAICLMESSRLKGFERDKTSCIAVFLGYARDEKDNWYKSTKNY